MDADAPALPDLTAPAEKPRRGRKPGSLNKFTADAKTLILERGRPIELLADISRGVKIRVGPQAGPGEPTYQYPTLADRIAAARILLAKVLPDLKAQEISGPDGGPIQSEALGHDSPAVELARRVAFMLRQGAEAQGSPPSACEAPARPVATPEPQAAPTASAEPPSPPQPRLPQGYRLLPASDNRLMVWFNNAFLAFAATEEKAIEIANADVAERGRLARKVGPTIDVAPMRPDERGDFFARRPVARVRR